MQIHPGANGLVKMTMASFSDKKLVIHEVYSWLACLDGIRKYAVTMVVLHTRYGTADLTTGCAIAATCGMLPEGTTPQTSDLKACVTKLDHNLGPKLLP